MPKVVSYEQHVVSRSPTLIGEGGVDAFRQLLANPTIRWPRERSDSEAAEAARILEEDQG